MKRNALRVVYNPIAKHISYYFKNEFGEWCVLSGSSPLSRQYYTSTTMQERASEIALKIDEIYNRKNKGLDITFEGDDTNYQLFASAISEQLKGRNITCHLRSTKVIVTGKSGIGKTILIKELEKMQGFEYQVEDKNDYFLYRDNNNTEWYEIKGIDLGMENVRKAYDTISDLAKNSAAMIVYCIESTNRRIEPVEKDFIINLIDSFPELAGTIVLTNCTDKKGLREFIDEIEKMTDHIKVIPTLAKEFMTDIEDEKTGECIVLPPFGLKDLAEYIFERR